MCSPLGRHNELAGLVTSQKVLQNRKTRSHKILKLVVTILNPRIKHVFVYAICYYTFKKILLSKFYLI